jgi:uncharacterized protein
MECRVGCGACCIALSISSPIPGMPGGKPAGVRCIHLTPDNRCDLFGKPERPDVCRRLRPSEEMCGRTREDALAYLTMLERATAPAARGEAESDPDGRWRFKPRLVLACGAITHVAAVSRPSIPDPEEERHESYRRHR